VKLLVLTTGEFDYDGGDYQIDAIHSVPDDFDPEVDYGVFCRELVKVSDPGLNGLKLEPFMELT